MQVIAESRILRNLYTKLEGVTSRKVVIFTLPNDFGITGRWYLVLNGAKQRTRTGGSGSAPDECRHIMDLKKEWGAEHIGKSACRVTRIRHM
jgi:hypothetical protein